VCSSMALEVFLIKVQIHLPYSSESGIDKKTPLYINLQIQLPFILIEPSNYFIFFNTLPNYSIFFFGPSYI